MTEQLRQYTVRWHTAPSPSTSYYHGEIKVFASDDEDAENTARREVHRRMFPDYTYAHHIRIDEVRR